MAILLASAVALSAAWAGDGVVPIANPEASPARGAGGYHEDGSVSPATTPSVAAPAAWPPGPAEAAGAAPQARDANADVPAGHDPGRGSARAGLTTDAADPADTDIEEVIVISTQEEKSERLVSRVLSAEEIFSIPALRDDALGAIDTYAGVVSLQTSVFDGPPTRGYYFRGANQGDNHFEIDGLGVGYVYHLGGPFSFSVINGRLVERLKFYPSNPSLDYPNVNGGVIDVRLKQPPLSGFHQEYDIGTLSAGAMIEGGFGNGRDGYWLAVRRSYIDFFLNAASIGDDEPGAASFPEFYDLQGRWYRSLENGFTDLTFIVSRDEFLINLDEGDNPHFKGDLGDRDAFAVCGWRVQIEPGPEHLFRAQINYRLPESRFVAGSQGVGDPSPGSPFNIETSARAVDVNADHTWQPQRQFSLRYGFDLSFLDSSSSGFIFSMPALDTGVLAGGISDAATALADERIRLFVQEFFLQGRYRPIENISIEFGLRTHGSQRRSSVPGAQSARAHFSGISPRLHLLYSLSGTLSFYYRWGAFVQLPEATELSAGLGNPATLDLERSRSNLAGLTWLANTSRFVHELSLELWHRDLRDLIIPAGPDCVRCLSNRGRGLARGIDFEWTFRGGRDHYLRLAYSWQFTERRNSPAEAVYPSVADQPQTFKLLYSGPVSLAHERLRWGFFLTVNSGQAHTPVVDRELRESEEGSLFFEPVYGAVNSRHYPSFVLLNLGISYTSRSGVAEYRFSLLSAHNLFRSNVTRYRYSGEFENLHAPEAISDDFLIPAFVMVFRI